MNPQHQAILDFIESQLQLSEEEKEEALKLVKEADKALTISEFKLERTEKVKRTTAILLEETIDELEQKRKSIEEANQALNDSIEELKATQAQLVHSEKMASLGELTAGIAHEIKNPLNFVNNFSEVSKELLDEMNQELKKGNFDLVAEIAEDVNLNLEKILHHGKRADGIVKGMLQHSRSNSGKKEAVALNNFIDEFLRLAYHGLKAKDKSFNARMESQFDPEVGEIMTAPQELGRVILNLLTNAFYAVNEKKKETEEAYEPTVWISTKKNKSGVIIEIRDNGMGIPEDLLDKIFQPFFTTKPTGQGTGLGLSLSYDIIKSHGGELKVESEGGKGSQFIISLPIEEKKHGNN
ncbi:MAG: ATP-binding protein [Salegentibacter sp.]